MQHQEKRHLKLKYIKNTAYKKQENLLLYIYDDLLPVRDETGQEWRENRKWTSSHTLSHPQGEYVICVTQNIQWLDMKRETWYGKQKSNFCTHMKSIYVNTRD